MRTSLDLPSDRPLLATYQHLDPEGKCPLWGSWLLDWREYARSAVGRSLPFAAFWTNSLH